MDAPPTPPFQGRTASDPLTNLSATRNPIPFFGAGLLAEIPDFEIASHADPDDADGDGVSGRVNFDGMLVGRFGRKAQTARIEIFIRGPLFNHMGVTSNPLSNERRAELPTFEVVPPAVMSGSIAPVSSVFAAQAIIPDESTFDQDGAADPELSDSELFDLVSFAMLLAAPEPDGPSPATERGSAAFRKAGCDKCHLSSLRSPRGPIPAYTDLLVHDMGDHLADGFPMGEASGREFRTQPLWGVAASSPYLHDGRADTIDDAIRWHGGEAAAMRDAYLALPSEERDDLLAFLESLGGRTQKTAGLLPPQSEVPLEGQYGAPLAGLAPSERALFEQGRILFDRDFGLEYGLGPRFNGDACRSCHFDPVIGGAGPSGVDVRAYTDLLLHDIADPNALGIEEGDAGMHEFRTSPLWGLARSAPYLHDGRASTIEGAITEHAGEAAASRTEAANLSTGDKEALFAFLRSL